MNRYTLYWFTTFLHSVFLLTMIDFTLIAVILIVMLMALTYFINSSPLFTVIISFKLIPEQPNTNEIQSNE